MTQPGDRGSSSSQMRSAACKDCLREYRAGLRGEDELRFVYNEGAALAKVDRGQSRSDRCPEHRGKHRLNTQGMAVPYIDLETIGEVADRDNPTGPFGGLGPLPGVHEQRDGSVDLGTFGFGMEDRDIRQILTYLADPRTRIVVVKAGTGTGKSTYMPYRLLDPPADAPIRLADLGPIVVTEPRVQATTGVAGFVGTKMSGAGGVGPGFPVGFQVSGSRAHDESCQLIYVTDGTMINWLREGRLSRIGTVIVDEAHERSTNIDFIMGYLKREIDRYPHLRVIITSATFNEEFYREYFGGHGQVEVVNVPAVKTIGYGFPLFSELDREERAGQGERWQATFGADMPLGQDYDEAAFVGRHFTHHAPPLKRDEVSDAAANDVGWAEDLHKTTRSLLPLRWSRVIPAHLWKEQMPGALGRFVVELAAGLDEAGIYGDILGFLPTAKSIDEAVAIIKDGVGDTADVFALLSSLPVEEKEDALAARRKGDRRKIVVSTNLAETSLTVEGVRFVVDSGLIAQSDWDPELAQGGIPTIPHSRAGIRQRWGRVGRKSPGWVFPLYSKEQFLELPEDTPPGSTRDSLEQFVMTAKMGGIDDVVGFPWPAAFEPKTVELDESARAARDVFVRELQRAAQALGTSGAIDAQGDPTSFGKELSRSPGLGSTASAIAIMYADRLACVPEVVTILALLESKSIVGSKGILLDSPSWPDEWRYEAAERHRALSSACQDDAELVLQAMAVWERSDSDSPPWVDSPARRLWADRWWINHDVLLAVAVKRREVLSALSPAMKEEVKRFVEPALIGRARGVITRAMGSLRHRKTGSGEYAAVEPPPGEPAIAVLAPNVMAEANDIIPLARRKDRRTGNTVLSNIVTVEQWALATDDSATSDNAEMMRLLKLAAVHARPDGTRDVLSSLQHVWPAGARLRLRFGRGDDSIPVVDTALAMIAPSGLPAKPEPEAAGDDATATDAQPELDTSWPSPVALTPDPDVVNARALLHVERLETLTRACDVCHRCLAGEPENCLDPLHTAEAHATDELEAWRNRASRRPDVSHPRAVVVGGEMLDEQWYEIVGYDLDHGVPCLILRQDWRPPGTAWAPAVHPGATAGEAVEVVVGDLVHDHQGELRVFHRADGLGRFVLREAHYKPEHQLEHRQLAMSLNRRIPGLLRNLTPGQRLTGRAIPRTQPGCFTITFLETLHAHWQTATHEEYFYPAIAVTAPNDAGYVQFEFLVHDPDTGITHTASMQMTDVFPEPVRIGDPVAIRVGTDVARLGVGGRLLAPLLELADRHRSAFYPLLKSDEAITEIAARDLTLNVRGPLDRDIAETLAALDPAPEWQADCWLFWARSHHLRTYPGDVRPGSAVDRIVQPVTAPATTAPGEPIVVVRAQPEPFRIASLRRQSARLRADLGATALDVDGSEIVATFGSAEAAETGTKLLQAVLNLPAAAIVVPRDQVGAVIGKGGQNLNALRATAGLLGCDLDNDSGELVAIGTADAVRDVVAAVLAKATTATGLLHLASPGDVGALIGRGGSVVKDLRERSGLRRADFGRGTTAATLGPGPIAAIEEFIRLAAEIVPTVRGELVDARIPSVTDLVSGQSITNVVEHRFS
ncbi:KH domain-containing protein [Dactylosporangium cerinum]|uniref:KH domain-containing protein n=1 Tax=Dactylosporangium cerinum TaxID=1434730 RepID=A0ABV9WIW2_9ACTN